MVDLIYNLLFGAGNRVVYLFEAVIKKCLSIVFNQNNGSLA